MRVCVLGAGDLGWRIAARLAAQPGAPELLIAGRSLELPVRGFFVACCGRARVHTALLDVLDQQAVRAVLESFQPAVVVQCAALLSPWAVSRRTDRAAMLVRRAGFAAQLCAQLPALLSVMRAVQSLRAAPPVVNCSYPDLTHPILARLELAPLIGIGNAGMIEAVIAARLRARGEAALVRVCAHHAQVEAVMAADATGCTLGPEVYVGEAGRRADELAFQGAALEASVVRNELSAAHACAIIAALALGADPLRTSAPGPFGMPGGYPVRVSEGRVELDLPTATSRTQALEFSRQAARADGVEHIDDDGTLHLTASAAAALHELDPELAQPLSPQLAQARSATLRRALQLAG